MRVIALILWAVASLIQLFLANVHQHAIGVFVCD